MDLQTTISELRSGADVLRSTTPEERIEVLVTWARAWSDPRDEYRAEAIARLPESTGLSVEMVERGLDLAFESVEAHRLRAWWDREGASESSTRLTAHILSSNVFVAGLPPVLASLLAGVPAFLRPPSAQPDFARLLVRSWNERNLLGGQFLGSGTWDSDDTASTELLLRGADRVYVFGSDATVQSVGELAAKAVGTASVFGFGHRLSIGAVGREALAGIARWDSTLEMLGRDALAWDGQGCLTPQWVFVEGTAADAEDLARRAACFLPHIAEELPAGRDLDAAQGAARAAYLGQAGFEGFSSQGRGWAVASLSEPRLEPSPPARSLVFLPLGDLAELPDVLAPLGDHLQGLLYVGEPTRRESLAAALTGQGLCRAVQAGMLQRPPIDWNHDGVRTLHSIF